MTATAIAQGTQGGLAPSRLLGVAISEIVGTVQYPASTFVAFRGVHVQQPTATLVTPPTMVVAFFHVDAAAIAVRFRWITSVDTFPIFAGGCVIYAFTVRSIFCAFVATFSAMLPFFQAVKAAQPVGLIAVTPAQVAVSHAANPVITKRRSIFNLTYIAAFATVERIVQEIGSATVARIAKRGRPEPVRRVFGHTNLPLEASASGGAVTAGRTLRIGA